MTRPPRRPSPKSPANNAQRRDSDRRIQSSPRDRVDNLNVKTRGKTPTSGQRTVGGERPDGTFYLFGRHPVEAALANPKRRKVRLIMTRSAAEDLQTAHGLPMDIVERDGLETLLPAGALHQGIALQVFPLRQPDLAQVIAPPGPGIIAVLDQVSDPHNVGAILRSAAAFGLRALVVQDRHSPEETGTLAKSASGALERVPLVRVANLSQALDDMKEAGFWSAGLEARATATLAEANLGTRCAVVLGSEGTGLRRLVREHCDTLVCLPMAGEMESLNVSNAAAIAFYELSRSR